MFRVVITKKSNNYEKDYDDFGYSLCSRMCKRSGVYRRRFQRLSGNLVGISINLCKSIQKELFINDTP